MAQFNIQLISEFGGVAAYLPIVKWLKNVELIYVLCDLQEVEQVIPLWLRGGILAAYRQFSKE